MKALTAAAITLGAALVIAPTHGFAQSTLSSRAGTSGRTSASPRDGAPGNPPSTVTGRAVDRMQGETPRPDGTRGNPPGTAAGRALDRATGSNTTGANPGAPATSSSGGTNRR